MSLPIGSVVGPFSAEVAIQLASGNNVIASWEHISDPSLLASSLFLQPDCDVSYPVDLHAQENISVIPVADEGDSLDSDRMFLEDSAMPAHSESGLPRDEEEPLSAATSLTQEGFVGTPDYDAPPKRGRKKLPLTKKGQQKLEKQQKKLEIDKERENSLCAKYQVVIENNPWEFKRNSVPFVARWNKIVGILKERKLLENIPNASKLFQNHVSKALEKFYKVFVKRPTGTEPPAMDDKDQLLLEIYQLKKSGPVGEGINPGAEDRRRGLEKRTMARRTLGMSTANKVSDLLADDEDILDYNSDERICLREEAEATGLVGRLNRKESFELDIDGPLWRNNAVVSSSKSNGKVMFVHKRKGNLPGKEAETREEAAVSDNAAEDSYRVIDEMNVDDGDKDLQYDLNASGSPKSSDETQVSKKRENLPKAAIRGKKRDMVDAVMKFSESAKEAADMQWKQWLSEQKQMEFDRALERELQKQKFELEKERIRMEAERMQKEEEARDKDRKLDLEKHLASLNVIRDALGLFAKTTSAKKTGETSFEKGGETSSEE